MLVVSVPAVGTAQILIWSYSCVFLPMSTAIRTSPLSFDGALIDLLDIPQAQSAQLIVLIAFNIQLVY